jgi:hypothetical protein
VGEVGLVLLLVMQLASAALYLAMLLQNALVRAFKDVAADLGPAMRKHFGKVGVGHPPAALVHPLDATTQP